jgi:hypothetical protein
MCAIFEILDNLCDKMAFLHKESAPKPSEIYKPALHWTLEL